ncbi:hypothetical protein OGAPHI_006605 [Ogataea philodendri]|uniref:BZIP domain-containing protein n=1 Tax=Ogataea philodendri TaxID=1378263 RepID=A0A9P8NWL0_9ASCO|nr:uncharacterized protein OGAPHI_006605 [Ogataea philodendri]KAH3661198.1 hypothetical protein OGAPHI_006605 [Ogataea philodendri]
MSSTVSSSSPDDGVHTKPGRKPISTEPSNKRTAQNRAAQRAFRERKEKKMKELEMKVQLLENEKLQITNETELLRIQVDTLMNELTRQSGGELPVKLPTMADVRQKNPGSVSAITSTDSEKSISNSSSPNNSTHTPTSSCSSAVDRGSESQVPWPDKERWYRQSEQPYDIAKNDLNKLNQSSYKDEFTEEVGFCDSLGTVCGNKEDPVPKSKRPGSVSGKATSTFGSSLNLGSEISSSSPFQMLADYGTTKSDSNDLPFLFDTPTYDASLVFDQSNPSAFSPSDLIFSTNEVDLAAGQETNPLDGLITEESKDDPFGDFFNSSQQLTQNNLNSLNGKSFKLWDEKDDKKDDKNDNDASETVPDTSKNLMKCSQIWERITTHPKFSELDIDGLCSELKMKAKCSEVGVVVDGKDVGDVLTRAFNKESLTELLNKQ